MGEGSSENQIKQRSLRPKRKGHTSHCPGSMVCNYYHCASFDLEIPSNACGRVGQPNL